MSDRSRRAPDDDELRWEEYQRVAEQRRNERSAERERRGARRRTMAWLGFFLLIILAAAAIVLPRLTTGDGGDGAAAATTEAPSVSVTFPEGLRREDMAAILEQETDLTGDDYLAATAAGTQGAQLSGLNGDVSLEGFLFPATYEVSSLTTTKDLVQAQITAFEANTSGLDYSYSAERNLTPYEVLIIASMIEREVKVPEERAQVASVIYNRLRNDMMLGIDATVQYAVGEWRPPTATDLQSDSPYNTRKFKGLPPGPIASPGQASLVAAARPDDTDFLFYVARADGTGGHYFAKTADEFEQRVAQARNNAAGG